jgi:hypothetical protein
MGVVNLGLIDGRTVQRVSYQTAVTLGGLANIASTKNVALPATSDVAGSNQAVAGFIYQDHIVAGCPDCGDVSIVWLEDLLYMCPDCWNATAGGRFRQVKIPRNLTAIYAVLALRIFPRNRNWLPGETVKQLEKENAERPELVAA